MTNPAPFRADARMLRMWNAINKSVSIARRLDGRLNNLHLFNQSNATASEVEHQDGLDVQTLLLRRDRLLGIQADIALAQQLAETRDGELEMRVAAMASVDRLREKEEKELSAIDRMLDRLHAESTKHWAVIARMLTDIAKLRQSDAHFNKTIEMEQSKLSGFSAEEMAVIEAHKPKDDE